MKDDVQDMLLKEAMERQAAKVPPLSEGFEGRVMERMRGRRQNARRTIVLWASDIAAALIIALILWPKGKQEPLPVLPPMPTPSVIAEAASRQPLIPNEPIKPTKPINPVKLINPTKPAALPKQEIAEPAIEEPAPSPLEKTEERQEEEPVIPADKQALADIFLAEEALQVAYELQAQQEAIRAYAASLEGKALPKPIIAF